MDVCPLHSSMSLRVCLYNLTSEQSLTVQAVRWLAPRVTISQLMTVLPADGNMVLLLPIIELCLEQARAKAVAKEIGRAKFV